MPVDRAIRRVIIVGGGTAGWVAASALARAFRGTLRIDVVESPEIATVGVGEATIPPIIDFIRFLGIDESAFMRATGATYKLGIVFENWKEIGHRYWHPFGSFGVGMNGRPFYHFWHKARALGLASSLPDHSLTIALGDSGHVLMPDARGQPEQAGLRYAYHFDASLVAKLLRQYSEQAGVGRIEAKVVGASLDARGFIAALHLADGRRESADLFIDCSGFRGVLIDGVLKTDYLDWSALLPVDRAMAIPTASSERRNPFTTAAAHTAGWRWQIPLQHRVGNGSVYCSQWMTDDEAWDGLQQALGGDLPTEPRLLRFVTGRRRQFWNGNCIAMGLASGFLEPLESTSIHLIVSAVYKLIDHFPDRDFEPSNVDAYNKFMVAEFEGVRDFIVLHYALTQRRDTEFWRYCAAIEMPDSLKARLELYRSTGRIVPRPFELFTDLSWFFVLEGLGVHPAAYDPLIDVPDFGEVTKVMKAQTDRIRALVEAAPSHEQLLTLQPVGRA